MLGLIFRRILEVVPLGHRVYIFFSGLLGECPYLHSYMRDQTMGEHVRKGLRIDACIMETNDEYDLTTIIPNPSNKLTNSFQEHVWLLRRYYLRQHPSEKF